MRVRLDGRRWATCASSVISASVTVVSARSTRHCWSVIACPRSMGRKLSMTASRARSSDMASDSEKSRNSAYSQEDRHSDPARARQTAGIWHTSVSPLPRRYGSRKNRVHVAEGQWSSPNAMPIEIDFEVQGLALAPWSHRLFPEALDGHLGPERAGPCSPSRGLPCSSVCIVTEAVAPLSGQPGQDNAPACSRRSSHLDRLVSGKHRAK
jgi:hypothetical protein